MRHAIATLLLLAPAPPIAADMLADDRADVMYHRYDGGGVTVDGPSLLVRKKFAEQYAVTAGYYLDMVSSASIDVVTTASPYSEERSEYGLGFEYLRGKTTYDLGFSSSKEDDYEANTARFSISQDMFSDLTTVSLSFARGWDKVYRQGDEAFSEKADRRVYGIDISQIATRRLIVGLSWDTVTEEGYLNSPYRSVRYLDPASASGYSYEPERYPGTRTGSAVALRARYNFPYRFALHGEYRYYADDWDIRAHTLEVGYTHGFADRWIVEARYRYHTQEGADFYSDLFPRSNFQDYLARDKELSTMSSQTFGFGLSYEFAAPWLRFLERSSVNLKYDVIRYDYDDFRDLRYTGLEAGDEPLYFFDANVVQLYFSGWF
ncbi:MAG: hypothetical protein H6R27_1145 [Proteobacteria bacterium]|nr:hypothetical protein [Pseudomonadota bacterium]